MNMRSFVIFLYLSLAVLFLACKNTIDKEGCKRITKVEVFSLGYPDITFSVGRIEKEVRKNRNGLIINELDLQRIAGLLDSLDCIEEKAEWTGDIMVVCDFYCVDGKKFTLLYDSFTVKINESFYCDGDDLIKQIMDSIMQ